MHAVCWNTYFGRWKENGVNAKLKRCKQELEPQEFKFTFSTNEMTRDTIKLEEKEIVDASDILSPK